MITMVVETLTITFGLHIFSHGGGDLGVLTEDSNGNGHFFFF